jgi:hypothetical protein
MCAMQTSKGCNHKGFVATEFTAMFDHLILPTLLQHYHSDGSFAKERAAVAQLTGLEEHEVDYPFFLCMDNDNRHPHARAAMLTARYSKSEVSQMCAEMREHLILCEYKRRVSNSASSQERWRLLHLVNDQFVGEFAHLGLTVQQALRSMCAYQDPAMRILHPQQFQPLSTQTPELNMPAEHCVCTFKHRIANMLYVRAASGSPEIKLAVTYQLVVMQIVKDFFEKGEGRTHATRSVAKLPCAAQIIAAEEGEWITVRYQFQYGGAEKHRVQGTGGWWISNTRWT